MLSRLNPFRAGRERAAREAAAAARVAELDRLERQEAAALLRTAIANMTDVMKGAFDVLKASQAQTATFLAGFQTSGTPEVRSWDEERDLARFMEKRAAASRPNAGAPLPAELAGLSEIDQFRVLLDKLES